MDIDTARYNMSSTPDISSPPSKAPSVVLDPSTIEKALSSTNEPVSSTGAVETTPTSPRDKLPAWKWIITLIGLYLGALLYGLDTTIAADVQGPIYSSFGHLTLLPWVGLGFPMASVAVILVVGRAYALFNIKTLILSSIAIFEIGSAICGAANKSQVLIFGRVVAGVGGAGMYLGALTYVGVFSKTGGEQSLYNALIGLSWGVGAILGPVVGGAFSVSSATWRWVSSSDLYLLPDAEDIG
jgi:MFS family permease